MQFQRFGGPAADIVKNCLRILSFNILIGWPRIWESKLRRLSFSILVGWLRIWAKVASEESGSAFWRAGRGYRQKLSQKAQFPHFCGLAADMGKSEWLWLPSWFTVASRFGFVHRRNVFERPSDRGTSRQVTSKLGFARRCSYYVPWNLGFEDSCAVSSLGTSDLHTGAVSLKLRTKQCMERPSAGSPNHLH